MYSRGYAVDYQASFFIDLHVVFREEDGHLVFSPYLPGFLRDLKSNRPWVVGLCREDWWGRLSSLKGVVPYFNVTPGYPLCLLEEGGNCEAVWECRRKYNISLDRSALFLSRGSQLKSLAEEAGIGRLEWLRTTFLPDA